MKKILFILTGALMLTALASCNKVEYVTSGYVTFNSTKYSFDEDAGIVSIPVSVFGGSECTVAYTITDGTAKQGEDFVVVDKDGNPNTSGLLKVSANPAETDSIRVQLSYNPLRTKGKKFIISLASSATEGVVISGTKQCEVTILDLEDAVSKFFGKWGDADETIGFTIEEYDIDSDPDEIADYYPNCSFAITAGGYFGSAEMEVPVYGYYDAQEQTMNIYSWQIFNAYNFNGIGPHFVGLANADALDNDVVLDTTEGNLTFTSDVNVQLYTYPDGESTNYKMYIIANGTVLKKL